MNNLDRSPFWATPPFILLTDILQLDKVDPWKVDVGKLVGSFLQEMKRIGDIDFRVSGNALYSASVIFMKKTRELVQLGILPPEEEPDDEDFEIPMIHPPFRLTNRRVTIEELLMAMDKVLTKGVRQRGTPVKRAVRSRADPISVKWEVDRANVEENIAEVLMDLREIMKVGDIVKFWDALMSHTRKEIVRVFFALLHLYARSYVDIWEDEKGVIWVQLLEPPADEDRPVTEVQLQIDY
jgi:chromatin segregation and condensation protein Rec8/ScpA/Scc1 (kleisin family)